MGPNEPEGAVMDAAHRMFKALVPAPFYDYVIDGGRTWAISLWHDGVQAVEPIQCQFEVEERRMYYSVRTDRLVVPVHPEMVGRSRFHGGFHYVDGTPMGLPQGPAIALRDPLQEGGMLALTDIGIHIGINCW